MKTLAAPAALILAFGATASIAGVKVDHDPEAGFSKYATYARGDGTPAAYPNAQKWIETVDRSGEKLQQKIVQVTTRMFRKFPPK